MKFDTKEIKSLRRNIRGLKVLTRSVLRDEMNGIADRHLARCIKNTDVGDSPDSPTLRNAWDRTPVLSTRAGVKAEVFNPIEYASFYEQGHRQQPGRIVFIELSAGTRKYGQIAKVQKNGKSGIFIKLVKPYVKGRFVLLSSEKIAQKELDHAAMKIDKIIEEAHNG